MKNVSFLVLLAMAFLVLVSCGSKESKEEQSEVTNEEEWKALDDFHVIMADVYHPLKDSGNLQPIKNRSKEFAEAADKFAGSDLPEKVNTDQTKEMLSALQESAHGIDDAIKQGSSDEEIKALLEGIHTLFHHIQEEWYAGAAEEHEEH